MQRNQLLKSQTTLNKTTLHSLRHPVASYSNHHQLQATVANNLSQLDSQTLVQNTKAGTSCNIQNAALQLIKTASHCHVIKSGPLAQYQPQATGKPDVSYRNVDQR
ncbi:hypothetical protein F511_05087 [Dorcoceras hygrometricum]|uniref:Uncharacterized protein n=1 Tax=Dorcoceras hygrometricum TaxID=472368 RepID=A0A2Z7DBP9_9LAMI|nr:hypothetical protein F511_05087 [Dorcoceras hygrometricum]